MNNIPEFSSFLSKLESIHCSPYEKRTQIRNLFIGYQLLVGTEVINEMFLAIAQPLAMFYFHPEVTTLLCFFKQLPWDNSAFHPEQRKAYFELHVILRFR